MVTFDAMKPRQPYFVISSEQFYHECYFRQGISHFYSYTAKEDSDDIIAVPDGCIDLIFEYGDNEMRATACGTVLEHQTTGFRKDKSYFGVRFMQGVQPQMLDASLKELIGKQVDIRQIMRSDELLERMEQQKTFEGRMHAFLNAYTTARSEVEPTAAHRLVQAVRHMICDNGGEMQMKNVEQVTGYTTRYIHKTFSAELGFGPKTLCRIVRFQRTIARLNCMDSGKLTNIAADTGYYDQSQFIRDFKQFADITPRQYVRMMQLKEYKQHAVQTNLLHS